MNEEFRIISFDPLTADDALWEKYFDQTEAYYRESNPGEPMLPRAKKKEHSLAAAANPYGKTYDFLVLGPDGRAAASAYILAEKPKSPTYEQNKHIGNLHGLSVLPACRRRGLGTALLRHVLREMALKEPQFTELMVPSAMESGHRFLAKLGAALALEHGENRLYLKDAHHEVGGPLGGTGHDVHQHPRRRLAGLDITVVLYSYRSRKLLRNHHAIGPEKRKPTMTSREKSFEIRITKLETEAPITLRMPTSLVRCSAVNAARPKRPRHVMIIANEAKMVARRLIKLMVENFLSKSASAKRNSNG